MSTAAERYKLQCRGCEFVIEIPARSVSAGVGACPTCGTALVIQWHRPLTVPPPAYPPLGREPFSAAPGNLVEAWSR